MRRALIIAVLLATAAAARAQVREEVTVEVVDIPVYVYNNGQAVRNLTKDDFELFVNGKRQQIDYFDTIDFSGAAEKVRGQGPDARNRRLFLFIFDVAYSMPAALARSQAAAITMVNRALPTDLFAVVANNSTGMRFIIPFTRDQDVVRRALLQLSPSRARDALSISITSVERQSVHPLIPAVSGDVATIGPGGSVTDIGKGKGGENPLADLLAMAGTAETQRGENLASASVEDFRSIARRFGQLEGERHAILFTSGFSMDLVTGTLPPPGVTGLVPEVNPQMRRNIDDMVKEYRAAGVLLHTVDITAPDAWKSGSIGNDLLLFYASRTGGEFIHGTNDFAGALAELSTVSSTEYRLGFKPVSARKGDNEIEVRVKNAPHGTVVSYRKGFSTTPPRAKAADALLLADIIQNDRVQSGTPPSFMFRERPFLDVVVPARQLAREFGSVPVADLMLYVFDDKGSAVVYREKKIAIAANPRGDLVVREKLDLPSGKYVAKSLLRVGSSLGFAKVEFAVP